MSDAATVAPERASGRTWLAVTAGMIGAFMAILNIQITNASLPNIEGGIGTGVDEGAWVSTAYLIGEIIVIPLTVLLARVFSFRRVIICCTLLFAFFSVCCSFASDLGTMIVMRGLQGFCGGVLIPMAMTMAMTRLPKAQQAMGLAMFALSATFAPAIGPTIGGWLTETYGWRTVFMINVPPSLLMAGILWVTEERKPFQFGLLRQADWPGIACMAIGLGSLQTMLEEGNKDDWFGSPFIVRLGVIAALFLLAFVVIQFTARRPLLNLRLLRERNFGVGIVANILVGFALYGSVYVLPQYLSQVQNYNSEQTGHVLAWNGLPQLLLIPLVPWLMRRVDLRFLCAGGIALFSFSCFMNTHLSTDVSGDQFLLPNLVRALGQAAIITPLTAIAMARIVPAEAANASALLNMLRNLGGAVGTALLQTIITKREQFHSDILGQAVTLTRPEVRARLDQLTGYFLSHGADKDLAGHQAVVQLGRIVRRQSLSMGFADTFAVLGAALGLAALSILLARRGGTAAAGAH
ncbi:MDR family MFS transporter [Rhizosaccharibacter radicis]|uniref:Multidrug efflux MFS transporter n=1 Tax=Rhizosaccharibacter radicis TaxID=2782605 RepID=A0ABT1VX46_9PROT|nr:multidrug efflux MFS transporter [Acetobacteraceae bacterium KSS12]